MIEVVWDSKFKKSYRKLISKNPELEDIFWEKLEYLQENLYHPFLKTHKLSGQLKDYMAFSVDYDIRVLFKLINKTTIHLIDIGTHDVIY